MAQFASPQSIVAISSSPFPVAALFLRLVLSHHRDLDCLGISLQRGLGGQSAVEVRRAARWLAWAGRVGWGLSTVSLCPATAVPWERGEERRNRRGARAGRAALEPLRQRCARRCDDAAEPHSQHSPLFPLSCSSLYPADEALSNACLTARSRHCAASVEGGLHRNKPRASLCCQLVRVCPAGRRLDLPQG